MCRISAQQSEASFSSQRRPRETSEATQEPPGEQEPPSGPQTLKEKFMSKLKSLSVMPSPNQALETFREESGLARAPECQCRHTDHFVGSADAAAISFIDQRACKRVAGPAFSGLL